MRSGEDRRGGIRIRALAKSYGPVPALRAIDLDIPPGETVAILGPNGAGKSTTIDIMLGLARPDSGSVSIFGLAPEDAVRAGRIGGMLQTGSLIQHLRVRELVTMVGSLYPHPMAVDEVLRLTDTAGLADRDTMKLSGGQTQRVRFALALVGDADMLVLDEPTAALDVESRRELWAVIRGAAETGKTVIFATHNLVEADAYADRVILMARGRVVADGPATELKARVGGRTIRATLPRVQPLTLEAIPGVTHAERRGDAVTLSCSDSDRALPELLRRHPEACDIEVHGAALEDAFLELTAADTSELEGARP